VGVSCESPAERELAVSERADFFESRDLSVSAITNVARTVSKKINEEYMGLAPGL
jgi:hypothetical protein